jgi:hypothetical protein
LRDSPPARSPQGEEPGEATKVQGQKKSCAEVGGQMKQKINDYNVTVVVYCSSDLQMMACSGVRYEGNGRISASIIGYEHDESGVFCPRCRPSHWSSLPEDPDDPHQSPEEKERQILDALDECLETGLSVIEVEDKTGIKRTTAYRRLAALEERGMIKHEGEKFFLTQ